MNPVWIRVLAVAAVATFPAASQGIRAKPSHEQGELIRAQTFEFEETIPTSPEMCEVLQAQELECVVIQATTLTVAAGGRSSQPGIRATTDNESGATAFAECGERREGWAQVETRHPAGLWRSMASGAWYGFACTEVWWVWVNCPTAFAGLTVEITWCGHSNNGAASPSNQTNIGSDFEVCFLWHCERYWQRYNVDVQFNRWTEKGGGIQKLEALIFSVWLGIPIFLAYLGIHRRGWLRVPWLGGVALFVLIFMVAGVYWSTVNTTATDCIESGPTSRCP
jgi:hypothetical protein